MLTIAWHNHHIYHEGVKILHLITAKRKYISIVNTSAFFLYELEEMTNCIQHVEAANAGLGL